MLEINNIFICDDIVLGQFNKVNLIGYNPSNEIRVSSFPYDLTTYVVVKGLLDEKYNDLFMSIEFLPKDRAVLKLAVVKLNDNTKNYIKPIPLFISIKAIITLTTRGHLILNVKRKSTLLYKKTYAVVKGKSPVLKGSKHLPSSKIFSGGGGNRDFNFVVNFLGKANLSLDIYDNFVDPASLIKLFSKVDKNSKIRIISSVKMFPLFPPGNLFVHQFPLAEIKFADLSHDRFVVLNKTEYYSFGHSLKDVSKGKYSKFTKIIDKREVNKIKKFFESAWAKL